MTQLALAYGLGMLALLSPCGFMMLPAFLAYHISAGDPSTRRPAGRLGRGVGLGLAVSVGFAGTFVLGGLLVSAGLRSLTEAVPWFSVLIGAGLMVLGLAILAGRRVGVTIGTRFLERSGSGGGRMIGFGVAYALTELACGMGSLLALVGTGVAATSSTGTVGIFLAFSLGSTTMLLLLSVSSALMNDVLARSLRRALPVVTQVSGAVLALTGVYLIVYWAPAMFGGNESDNWASRYVHTWSAVSRQWVQGNELIVTVLAVLVVVASILVVRRNHTRLDASADELDRQKEDVAAR